MSRPGGRRREPTPAGLAPEVASRREDGADRPMLVWRLPVPRLAVSSSPLGGGLGVRRWVLNAEVAGPGVGMLTAACVERVRTGEDEGVAVAATVGLTHPVWAAALAAEADAAPEGVVGTINIVAFVPARLTEAALVNAVATVTEAKAQALGDAGVAGTGTPTDAVCVLCPADGPADPFGGPRSRWGAPLARAVHTAVLLGP